MTAQISDTLIYDNRTFIIIDIEYGKYPHTEFVVIPDNFLHSTDNYRRYEAEYSIEDGQLFGRQVLDMYNNISEEEDEIHHTYSPKTPLHYTGSMLIGRNKDDSFWTTDYLPSYLYADEAFELYFENGILTETRNLDEALSEFGTIQKSLWWTSELISPAERSEVLDEHCRTHLKYRYGSCTYRWNTGFEPETPDEDREYFQELEEKERKWNEDCAEVEKVLSYLPLFREKKGNFLKRIPAENEDERVNYEIIDKDAYDKFMEFETFFYKSPLFDKKYMSHTKTLFAYYPDIDEAILHADRTEICAILTGVIRSYYFCVNNEGYEEDIEKGTYIPILENLGRIIDETYHPWKKTDVRTGDARFIGMKNQDLDETLPPDDTKTLEKQFDQSTDGKSTADYR